MSDLKFSIVIATYNRPSFLVRCIESIIATKESDLDIIVVDDCSDVSYEEFVEKYPWVTYKKLEVNSGPCVARNQGIALAKNNWVIIFDDDDEMLVDAFISIRENFAKIEGYESYPLVQFFRSNAGLAKDLLEKDVVFLKESDYLEERVKGDYTYVLNKDFFCGTFQFPDIKVGAEGVLLLEILKKYTIPTFSVVVCKINDDAPLRLTDVKSQIDRASEYADLQKMMLQKFEDTYLKYPDEKIKRQIGFVVYKILSGDKERARKYLNEDVAGLGAGARYGLWLLSFLPVFLVRIIFICYRSFGTFCSNIEKYF